MSFTQVTPTHMLLGGFCNKKATEKHLLNIGDKIYSILKSFCFFLIKSSTALLKSISLLLDKTDNHHTTSPILNYNLLF